MTSRPQNAEDDDRQQLTDDERTRRQTFADNMVANRKFQNPGEAASFRYSWELALGLLPENRQRQPDPLKIHWAWREHHASTLLEKQAERRRKVRTAVDQCLKYYLRQGLTIDLAGDTMIRCEPYGRGSTWTLDELKEVLPEFGWKPKRSRRRGGEE
ncbi:MAG: hypothetical protein JF595_04195 [Sphingomonadales bacterium]|nr:hypothetical protein [Sphingomonadales bacterium]